MRAEPTASQFNEPPRTPSGESARVLVVDDDRRRAYLLKGILMAAGHFVQVAEDADAALSLARADHPALAVVAASIADAVALVATFEHDPDTRKTQVIVLGNREELAPLVAAGAEEQSELPVQPSAFRETCQRLLVEASRRHAPKVLVIDDDASIRAVCREILEHTGYSVHDLASADHATAEARRFRPDLILLDVMMPGVDGFRTAEKLRNDPVNAMTPIIFLSAKGDTADKVRAFRSGAEDYVVDTWREVDLTSLLGATTLTFSLASSDVGALGMNTPAYFKTLAIVCLLSVLAAARSRSNRSRPRSREAVPGGSARPPPRG